MLLTLQPQQSQTGTRFIPPPPPPRRRRRRRRRRRGWDPIAQSFLVFGDTGVFLTSVDIYFSDKDPNDIPVIFQLRTMENGIPTQKILPFSEVTVTLLKLLHLLMVVWLLELHLMLQFMLKSKLNMQCA